MRYIVRAIKRRMLYVENMKREIPNLEISLDNKMTDSNSAYMNFLNALEMAGEDACVHLEDDITLTSNFKEKIEKVISENKDQVIQFFSMRKKDLDVGTRMELGSTFLMAQCFYMPKGLNKKLLKYCKEWINKNPDRFNGSPLDNAVADFLKENKIKYLLSVPSLVQHLEVKSVIDPRRSTKRQSKTFQE